MQLTLSLLALGYVASAGAFSGLPLHPGGIGGFFRGPNSETIIKGPDGSVITAAAEGGAVLTEQEAVPIETPVLTVAEPAPVLETAVAVAEPAPVIEAVAVPAPVVESNQSSDLIGPSGRIVTKGSQSIVAGPASTTVTGPAIVAETLVKGPPLVAAPVVEYAEAPLPLAPAPIPVPAEISVASVSLPPISVSLGPVAVTASPFTRITASPLPVLQQAPQQGVATASASPLATIASATAPLGGSATATATREGASASVKDLRGSITTATSSSSGLLRPNVGPLLPVGRRLQLPELVAIDDRRSSTLAPPIFAGGIQELRQYPVSSTLAPPVLTSGFQELGLQDQLAINNGQLSLSRGLVQPEISVTPRTLLGGGLRATSETLYTTPGLGSVSSSTNIQREEGDGNLGLTPTELTQVALQNRQILLNRQLEAGQQGSGRGINEISNLRPNEGLFLPARDERTQLGLTNIPQRDLLRPAIDGSQLQLTNVPLSAVNSIPRALGTGAIDGNAWGRYERQTEAKKKN